MNDSVLTILATDGASPSSLVPAIRRSPFTRHTEAGEPNPVRDLPVDHLGVETALGANLVAGGQGATFKVWAPAAREVRLWWNFTKSAPAGWIHNDEARLVPLGDGTWGGFVPDVHAGEHYLFHVVGPEGGTTGLKRDPYARELTCDPAWPDCHCVLVDPARFPWHDKEFRPAPFEQLILYQFHVGVWHLPAGRTNGTFLDVATRLPYLHHLGINAVLPLPIVEFPTTFSLGYNGVDYFSPETDYSVRDTELVLGDYLGALNEVLHAARPRARPYELHDIRGAANQFKVLVDLCHVHGIAVLVDVVYHHAGGDFGDRSLYFFDRRPPENQNDSLYFTDRGWAGGLVFAYWNEHVRRFLTDNATYHLSENHCDGLRYDEVSVIKDQGGEHGWRFCQAVTDACRRSKPSALQIAECWPVQQAIVRGTGDGGAGFDATQSDGLRDAVRDAIAAAAHGAGAWVDLDRIARNLACPVLADAWRAVQCTESHDIVRVGRGGRIPRIADGRGDPSSWYVRSRARVALGLTVTAPGIPQLFMGQETLESAPWTDDPAATDHDGWASVERDRNRQDFLRYAIDVIGARRWLKGLGGSGLNVFHVHELNRVLAFHRWVPGEGHDVVVVASLNDATFPRYVLGFPGGGAWREVLNSDFYDQLPNPQVAGNAGAISADGGPLHGLSASATITIPANSILIFVRWV